MTISASIRRTAMAFLLLTSAGRAQAQLYENVGTRAQGMSGAFVAVADDASAGWWNPAGLATGAVFNVVIEHGRVTEPRDTHGLNPATTTGTTGFALALPSLGVNNYRMRISQIDPPSPTGDGDPTRQDQGGEEGRVRSIAVSQFGVTVGQSLGDHFVVGSTVKLVRSGVATATVDGTEDALDVANDLDVESETRFDLDLGAMLSFTHLRLGASLRNATKPEFGEGDRQVVLGRQARAGMAIFSGPVGVLQSVVLAADFDLTETSTLFGEVRHAAGGVEVSLLQRRLSLRGGASRNTVGASRPATSTGFSLALMRGFFVEGSRTFGADDSLRGWSSSVRLTF